MIPVNNNKIETIPPPPPPPQKKKKKKNLKQIYSANALKHDETHKFEKDANLLWSHNTKHAQSFREPPRPPILYILYIL